MVRNPDGSITYQKNKYSKGSGVKINSDGSISYKGTTYRNVDSRVGEIFYVTSGADYWTPGFSGYPQTLPADGPYKCTAIIENTVGTEFIVALSGQIVRSSDCYNWQ